MDENPNSEGSTKNNESLRDALMRLQTKLQKPRRLPIASELIPDDDTKPLDEPEPSPPEPPVSASPMTLIADDDQNSDHSAPSSVSGAAPNKVDRETRHILRRVQDHLITAQAALGAVHETVNLMEVVYHPDNTYGNLNYTTPRRKTAWVSANQIQHGVDYLIKHNRLPRIIYIEGLFPPLFAKNLRKMKFEVESESSIMIYLRDGYKNQETAPLPKPRPPYNLRAKIVDDVNDAAVWWYIWENAYYDVITLGVEPLAVGRTLGAIKMGHQLDIILQRDSFPIGVARVTIQNGTAHVVGLAILREQRTPELLRILLHMATYAALERGCDLVFTPTDTDEDRHISRELGFMDFGSIVCYAAMDEHPSNQTTTETHEQKPVAHPILNLKRPIQ